MAYSFNSFEDLNDQLLETIYDNATQRIIATDEYMTLQAQTTAELNAFMAALSPEAKEQFEHCRNIRLQEDECLQMNLLKEGILYGLGLKRTLSQ